MNYPRYVLSLYIPQSIISKSYQSNLQTIFHIEALLTSVVLRLEPKPWPLFPAAYALAYSYLSQPRRPPQILKR